MAIFTADIEGLEELMKAVSKISDEAMPYIWKAATEAGEMVLAKTEQAIPVDTGLAKKSLRLKKMAVKPNKRLLFHSVTYKGSSWSTLSGWQEGGNHIPLIEFGHRIIKNGRVLGKVEKRPFMRDTADANRERVVEIVTKYLNEALDKAGR